MIDKINFRLPNKQDEIDFKYFVKGWYSTIKYYKDTPFHYNLSETSIVRGDSCHTTLLIKFGPNILPFIYREMKRGNGEGFWLEDLTQLFQASMSFWDAENKCPDKDYMKSYEATIKFIDKHYPKIKEWYENN